MLPLVLSYNWKERKKNLHSKNSGSEGTLWKILACAERLLPCVGQTWRSGWASTLAEAATPCLKRSSESRRGAETFPRRCWCIAAIGGDEWWRQWRRRDLHYSSRLSRCWGSEDLNIFWRRPKGFPPICEGCYDRRSARRPTVRKCSTKHWRRCWSVGSRRSPKSEICSTHLEKCSTLYWSTSGLTNRAWKAEKRKQFFKMNNRSIKRRIVLTQMSKSTLFKFLRA